MTNKKQEWLWLIIVRWLYTVYLRRYRCFDQKDRVNLGKRRDVGLIMKRSRLELNSEKFWEIKTNGPV